MLAHVSGEVDRPLGSSKGSNAHSVPLKCSFPTISFSLLSNIVLHAVTCVCQCAKGPARVLPSANFAMSVDRFPAGTSLPSGLSHLVPSTSHPT